MLDELIKQPFSGFEPEAIEFLKKLRNKRNNNKKWFDKHRNIYEEYIKLPIRDFVDELSVKIKDLDPEILIGHRSIYRINRDIRFAKEKHPYNQHVSVGFCFHEFKKDLNPSFYFRFDPDAFYFGAGIYFYDKERTNKIKQRMINEPEKIKKIISNKDFKETFEKLQGEHFEKMPKEYRDIEVKNKILEDLLMRKQFYVYKYYPLEVIFDGGFLDLVFKNCKISYNFIKFLDESIRN